MIRLLTTRTTQTLVRVTLWFTLAAALSGCTTLPDLEALPARWSIGYWFWQYSAASEENANPPMDVIFFQAGQIEKNERRGPGWNIGASLPDSLPAASEYWMVLRYERQAVPDASAIPPLVEAILKVQRRARRQQILLKGIQLDIDAPTRSLHEYAVFLSALHKAVPKGFQVSITALLDWFRSDTAIPEVVASVDEYVPQFYDLGPLEQPTRAVRYLGSPIREVSPIAAKIDSKLWGERFNKLGKPYRIGISSFARAAVVSSRGTQIYGDLSPMTFGSNPAFALSSSRTPANELFLKFRTTRPTNISYARLAIGDVVEFILPTPESIRSSYNAAKAMGGYATGVVFFRWPSWGEQLALTPDFVRRTIETTSTEPPKPRIVAKDAGCVAVSCVDLHVYDLEGQADTPQSYSIASSLPLEYFVPEPDVPVRLANPEELKFVLPRFSGLRHLYLGRAVTTKPSEFSLGKEQ